MHDPVDIRRRIDRLVARVDRRDDYGQLLACGQVIHRAEDLVDVGAWRAEIGRQARADKMTVRTGVDNGLVWRSGRAANSLSSARRYVSTTGCCCGSLHWPLTCATSRRSCCATATR